MPKALKAGFETYWKSYGQGPRAALMIHCSLASSAAWGPLAGHLSGALDMTAFDMPGHGRSAAWDDRGEIQGVTADIAAAFLEGPTDVIGHSFGATVALRLAVERPELVRTLTLIEPVLIAVALADRPDVARDHAIESADFEAAMIAADHMAAARAFTGLWSTGLPFDALPDDQQKLMAAQMPFVGAGEPALFHDAGQILAPERLSRVSMPVLLIDGSATLEIVSVICDGLHQRLPHASRAVIMGAGHMLPITHAQQTGHEILRFLA
ncbi:alpha/beta hydrolase [uncultured Roseovarius sp.]|uniref:alpha/beta fold hydrolase n=1 Tax=uncultured Roseovarius sp. TaxID=293344 RepID=UPI00261AE6E0|nr:alpha/beta hydrolase [uncultured Roseovarius sp.]